MDLIWQLALGVVSVPATFFSTRSMLVWAMGDKEDEGHVEFEFDYYEAAADLRDSLDVNAGLKKELEEALGHLQRSKLTSVNEHREHIGVKGMRWGKERTVKDVYDEMTDEQKSVLHLIVEESLDKNNPSELDLVKFTFETLTFEQKRVACWLFSDSMDDEKLDLWFSDAYKVYDNMSDQNQRWIGTQKFRIRRYLHNGEVEYQGVAYYLAEQIGRMCQIVEKTNFDEVTYQDNLRYLTKPSYESSDL